MNDVTRIFISYHRSDGEADAGRLADTLRRTLGDERVFTDVTNIEFGANWERVVDHTLQDAVAVLLVIGPAWSLTEPIKYELGLALDAGVAIIPVLMRGANWATVTGDLPSELRPLQKFNAIALDHGRWASDVERLTVLLESMLKDFARARVICRPPEPISVLQTAVNTENVRSLLVHAADLAECLDDASVLTEAQQVVPMYSPDSHERPPFKEAPSGLVSLIVDARYRLMMEQIGRDLLKYSNSEYDDPIWERPAQYLGDVALLESIRSGREEFKEERSETIRTRGDSGDPGACQRAVLALVTSARDRLRAQLPGLTKQEETRERLFELVENQVTEILSKGRIEDQWDYIILKHFSSYPDMRRFLYDKDRPKAQAMLKYFETPI